MNYTYLYIFLATFLSCGFVGMGVEVFFHSNKVIKNILMAGLNTGLFGLALALVIISLLGYQK